MIVPTECLPFTEMHRPGGNYAKDIESEFRMIEPHLPDSVGSIIDIGCGMAGIDVLLKRLYPSARLTLLDGEGSEPNCGWRESAIPCGSRRGAQALLAANGVEADEWIEAGTPEPLAADLVLSLLSWGFHYPLSAYDVRGFCIADLRHGREPERGKVIARHKTSSRCAFPL